MDFLRSKREYIPFVIGLIVLIIFGVYYFFYTPRMGTPTGGMTETQKLNILSELEKNSPPPPSPSTQQKILNDLSKQSKSGYQYTEEGKLQILQQLQTQGTKY